MDEPYEGKILHTFTKWTDPYRVNNFDKVHKVDGPYKGKLLDKSTKWTNPTRVKNLIVHKVNGPNKG